MEGPPRDGSTGDEQEGGNADTERSLLYRVAAETGLRRNELKPLHVADLDIEDIERASVSVRATNAKNRREARLPLRADLADADIEYDDAAGRVVGFHSLRVTFGTSLAGAAAHYNSRSASCVTARRCSRRTSPRCSGGMTIGAQSRSCRVSEQSRRRSAYA